MSTLKGEWSDKNTANHPSLGIGQGKWIGELAKLDKKRIGLHSYITMKLEDRDYHGVADAAMDLREIDARVAVIKELMESK